MTSTKRGSGSKQQFPVPLCKGGGKVSGIEEIFTIRARRCKRCGRLLTSAKAVADGYGEQCACKMRAEKEARAPIPGQYSFPFLDIEEGEDDQST